MEVNEVNVNSDSDNEGAVEKTSVTLSSIQHDDKVELFTSPDGKQRWKCLWCKKTFHWNPTKALFHLARISKSDIAVCTGKTDSFCY
jgi:transposase-like protein